MSSNLKIIEKLDTVVKVQLEPPEGSLSLHCDTANIKMPENITITTDSGPRYSY